ncbi:bifunctional solanapyrone synthase [Colletotrichum spaethianum]|uniref:Bifunctional solanapyrone synthase n=1 Tax=Colletotrichum spaethianum TaxID=700344 RepID=A0AA37P8P1_9PEZI|nr:bifunctional solanapyrone synthase [Colletotrichum spaethianum]GKT47695.1 bifunctional solanapyrone synthase [Colletotrichum spaethianum]
MAASSLIFTTLLVGLTSVASADPVLIQSCDKVTYPNQVLLRDQTEYTSEKAAFWSTIQGAASPACFFTPLSAQEVSKAVLAARNGQCQFAIKSGGHYSFEASTIENGLVVDLAHLNQTTVSNDRKSAIIEPGARWSSVYPILQEYNLTVPGGRMFDVGVGGLTLGGGISWLSNLHGLTCDNVLEYEVVLADGQIVTVTSSAYPDLYWALRGGGNNFAIVTKFKFNAFEQGKLWNGNLKYSSKTNVSAIAAFANWGNHLVDTDLKSGGVLLWDAHIDSPPTGTAILTHSDTFTDGKHPLVFDEFYEAGPRNISAGNAYHAEIVDGLVFPGGVTRNSFWTTSFELDAEMMQTAFDTWNEESKPIASIATQQLQLQIFTRAQMNFMKANGGNPTGLAGQNRPVGFVNIVAMWQKAEDDKTVYRVQQRIENRINAAAKERELYSIYKYTNYASQFQDPFTGYGSVNKARLLQIAKKYDPEGVFQTLVSGGFKLTHGSQEL